MKKIFLVAFIALIQLTLQAQTNDLRTNVDLNLPKSFVRTTNTELKSNKAFKSRSPVIQNPNFKGEFYTVDNSLVILNAASGTFKPDFLEKFEKEWMYSTKSLGNLTLLKSEIRNGNNFKVLILQHEFQSVGTGTYTIQCINKEHNKTLFGLIEYEQANRQLAAKLVETLLKSISFK